MSPRDFYHLVRRHGAKLPARRVHVAFVHHAINERAAYAQQLDGKIVAGKVGVIRTGHDCDLTAYCDFGLADVSRGLVAFTRREDQHAASLDGPETTRFVHPAQIEGRRSWSRDLALEAFEDGHGHVVHLPSFG